MKNSELLKALQQFPEDMEVVVFDHRQSEFYKVGTNGMGGVCTMGIHTEFDIHQLSTLQTHPNQEVLAITFDNDDYT